MTIKYKFINVSKDRLYSIPDACSGKYQVVNEYVCGIPHKEVPMDNKIKVTVRKIANWLSKKSIVIVIIISIFHIGLTCIHTRESGRADLIPFPLLPIFSIQIPYN